MLPGPAFFTTGNLFAHLHTAPLTPAVASSIALTFHFTYTSTLLSCFGPLPIILTLTHTLVPYLVFPSTISPHLSHSTYFTYLPVCFHSFPSTLLASSHVLAWRPLWCFGHFVSLGRRFPGAGSLPQPRGRFSGPRPTLHSNVWVITDQCIICEYINNLHPRSLSSPYLCSHINTRLLF